MLDVEGLNFSYADDAILRDVTLSVAAGEVVGVVGPNGSGKTTLIRLVTGLLKPDGGTVKVNDTDVSRLRARERARLIGVVPQNPQLPLGFSVMDLVLMGRNPHLGVLRWEGQKDIEVAVSAMKMTATDHLADRPLGNLSGGEQQRAVVATALAQEGPVLLLDEPTSSLDLAHQSGVMGLVRRVQRERGGAVLLAMHDLTLAAQYCDRIVMLAAGAIYADGPPVDVLTAANVREVYGAEVTVLQHPETGAPVVVPAPFQDAERGA